MRIVIDLQGAQTESRFRGIGRYSLSFAKAVVRNRGAHEVFIVLSDLFPGTVAPIRDEFAHLLPQGNIRVWTAPGPVSAISPGNRLRRETAELVREAFIQSLRPDLVHITSLFEGYLDDAVTSIGRLDVQTPVSVILYDLIPMMNPDHYLKPNPAYEAYYLDKLASLRKASRFLAISEFSRQEGVIALGGDEGAFVNISTAIDDNFRKTPVDKDVSRELKARFGIEQDFVLYTGGADERKNLPRLIKAFAGLSPDLRKKCQLLFAGKMSEGDMYGFRKLALKCGLRADELKFTDYVSDADLVQLYGICRLYVFPSWHEGFGLPALEAMACGAPVIGANTTSLPEVIGLAEAMFDPFDVSAITAKIQRALTDAEFCKRLTDHGARQFQAFSWDETARRAICAWEAAPGSARGAPCGSSRPARPRLAFVSPLPPERTGIAGYSADLLPALATHYDIELVVDQLEVSVPADMISVKVRDVAWLRKHAHEMNRVVYQMGNSPFHRHMLALMEEIPGVVVLHDFYLSSLMSWLELHGGEPGAWRDALYQSHGYVAVRESDRDVNVARLRYPANWPVISRALGVIVHSEHSKSLALQWYGESLVADWDVIPLVRTPVFEAGRSEGRHGLGFSDDEFVVCCFGFLDRTKMNQRLLSAWLNSSLARDRKCHLVFVGENSGDEYGASLKKMIVESCSADRIRITGFASDDTYRQYLASADMAVQLRTDSRGETSAAVLDCMNCGLPVIVNASGSMAELDAGAVRMLPEVFSDEDLTSALEALWRDPACRRQLGGRASSIIHERHSPVACAARYMESIERHYFRPDPLSSLVSALADRSELVGDNAALERVAKAISANLPQAPSGRRLYLDITATCRSDLKTGIERVARALLLALLEAPPAGYRIEPVYLSNDGGVWHHRTAARYVLGLMDCSVASLGDEPVSPEVGDMLLGLDYAGDVLVDAARSGLFDAYRRRGVTVHFMVHDLLPVRMPQVFPPGANEGFSRWLDAISRFDGAVCVSKTVGDDLADWMLDGGSTRSPAQKFSIGSSHHGADVSSSAPSMGLPDDAAYVLASIGGRSSFLMVGTIEPRKGYLQALEAFDLLWAAGHELNLVVVGQEGWKGLPDSARRDIPATIARLRAHPELNSRLFWLEGISDEFLEMVYAKSACLLAASYGEGFGLPLIEAAQKKLPILARDIPVFREVAGDHASYFDGESAESLQRAIEGWVEMASKREAPSSEAMPWLSWAESARNLLGVVGLADRVVG